VLGFINPALYTIGLGADYDIDFHDITSGGSTLGTTVGYDLSTAGQSQRKGPDRRTCRIAEPAAVLTSPTPGTTLTSTL